jgi:lipoate synthase
MTMVLAHIDVAIISSDVAAACVVHTRDNTGRVVTVSGDAHCPSVFEGWKERAYSVMLGCHGAGARIHHC